MEKWMTMGAFRLISYCIMTYVIFDFFKIAYGKKYENNFYYIGIYTLYVLGYMFTSWHGNPILNTAFSMTISVIISYLLFLQHPKKALYDFIFLLYLSIVDTIGTLICSIMQWVEMTEFATTLQGILISGIIAQITVLCTYQTITKILMKKSFDSVTWKQSTFLFLFVIFQITAIVLSVYVMSKENSYLFLLFLTVGFIGSDIYIIFLFQNLSEHNILKEQRSLETQQQALLDKHYTEMDQKYEQSRKSLHDMRYHLQMIESLYHIEESSEGHTYAFEVYKQIDSLASIFKSKNRILTVIITDVLQRAEILNIDCSQFFILDLDLSFIKKIDFTTILSNILNNAIEACESLKNRKRYIKLNIHEVNKNLVIYCVNPCENKSFDIKNQKTTKKGHMGIGLTNIQKTVDNYFGIFETDCQNFEFEVKISIPYPK